MSTFICPACGETMSTATLPCHGPTRAMHRPTRQVRVTEAQLAWIRAAEAMAADEGAELSFEAEDGILYASCRWGVERDHEYAQWTVSPDGVARIH